jgi:hypothetical protein
MFSFPALEQFRTHGIGVSVQASLGHHCVEIPNGGQEHIHTTLTERRCASQRDMIAIECRITTNSTTYIILKECFHRAPDLIWGSIPGGIMGEEVGKEGLQEGKVSLPGAIWPRLLA